MWKPALVLGLLCAACGPTLTVTLHGDSPQPVQPTMRCVSQMADSLGYKPQFFNGGKGVQATHTDTLSADYEDRRLEKIVATGAGSKGNEGGSIFTVVGSTVSQHWTRIGLESEEIPASDRVTRDANAILVRCGGAG
jgi:hypothetical protein